LSHLPVKDGCEEPQRVSWPELLNSESRPVVWMNYTRCSEVLGHYEIAITINQPC